MATPGPRAGSREGRPEHAELMRQQAELLRHQVALHAEELERDHARNVNRLEIESRLRALEMSSLHPGSSSRIGVAAQTRATSAHATGVLGSLQRPRIPIRRILTSDPPVTLPARAP